jgi:heme/copper-type cytochrome/quinol oxidase subunit 3
MDRLDQQHQTQFQWWVLLVWFGLLAGILIFQSLTPKAVNVVPFDPEQTNPMTLAEKLWHRLSLAAILLTSAGFFIAAKWLIPRKSTRSITRLWGCVLCFLALLFSLGIGLYHTFPAWDTIIGD